MARYKQGNFDFVIDSSFQPFSMQEMLVPFSAYKEEYDREEEAYTELSQKANDFEYLSRTLPEDSKARQVYEGYANDLKAQADDLTKNGLGMGNRRALLNMKRRYSGEIGRLVKADEALKKVQEMRMQKNAQDPSMLYTDDNLNIDMFLDNNNPNLYGISGNELYAKGAAAGRAASARIYSDPAVQKLDAYYNNYFNTVGYSPEKMQEFRDNLAAIPELQRAAMDIVQANKVGELGEDSANYKAALQQIVNGIADGAIYERKDNMQRNLGVMTAAEQDASARGWAGQRLNERQFNEVTLPAARRAATDWESQRDALYDYETKLVDKDGKDVPNPLHLPSKMLQMIHPEYKEVPVLDKHGNPKIKGYKPEILARMAGSTNDDANSSDASSSETKVFNPVTKKWEKKAVKAVVSTEEKNSNLIASALQGLNKDDGEALNGKEFSVPYKDSRGKPQTAKYAYVGAVDYLGGGKYNGKLLGEDAPNFFGFSSSGVIDWWGDYSATASSSPRRVLTEDEVNSMLWSGGKKTAFGTQVEGVLSQFKKATNDVRDLKDIDYEVVEVENTSNKGKDYLIAVKG